MSRVRSQFPQSVYRLSFVVVLAAMALVPLSAGVASAAPKVGVATVGSAGTTGGLFNTPRGVVVNQSGAGGVPAGTFYVADTLNHRLQRFNPDGSFHSLWGQDVDATLVGAGFELCTAASGDVCKAGITAGTGGGLNNPQALAIDQTDGSVYVQEVINRRIQKFTADGTFVWAAGWDVVSAGLGNDATGTPNQFETCVAANGDVCKQAAAAGANAGQFAAQAPGLAINPITGELVVVDQANRRIQRFSSAGAFVSAFGYDVVPSGQAGDSGVQLEACPTSAAQVTGGCQAGQTTNGGNNPGQIAAPVAGGSQLSVATDSAGVIYATDSGNSRLLRFTPTGSSALTFGASQFSPTARPLRIAVDKSNDHIYVVKGPGDLGDTAVGIAEFDVLGNLVETHAATANLPHPNGLDIRSPGGNLYYSEPFNHRLIVLGTTTPPTAALDDAATVTDTTATFSGSVNPNGLNAGYRFEYRPDSNPNFTKLPVTDADAGPVNSTNPISQNATGLEPNTLYHLRLVATKIYDGGTTTTAEKMFTTDSAPPDVTSVVAYGLDDTSVELTGRIDPNSQTTSYVFEYGTSPALGSSTPAAAIGNGANPVPVSQPLSGLLPDTTYHYRLVATNPAGPTPSPTKTFHTRATPLPSNDRAYEQVSPIDKNYGRMIATGAVSRDGSSVSYSSTSGFGEPPGEVSLATASYVSQRSDDAWLTVTPTVPRCGGGDQSSFDNPVLSPDLSRFTWTYSPAVGVSCVVPALVAGAPAVPPSNNIYAASVFGEPGYALLNPNAHTQLGSNNGFVDGTDDFGHVVFTSSENQTADTASSVQKVYAWHEGALSLVSRDASNVPFSTASAATSARATVNGMSVSGDRIFFNNGAGNSQELYVRENDAVTRWVSEQECSPACSNTSAADSFEWATADGSKALFMSAGKLTNDASFVAGQSSLYRYVDSANPSSDQNLVLVSKDNEPADGSNAGVLGVSGISDDGDTVFFVANGQIVPAGPTAAGPKVYRWRWNSGSPTVEYLATLHASAAADGYAWRLPGVSAVTRPGDRIVTGDGRRMVLETVMPLDPVSDRDSLLDVYRWDEADGWACLSCQAPDAPSVGVATLQGFQSAPEHTGGAHRVFRQRLVMTGDGERVFFTALDPLVSQDQNGDRQDVYEWDDGELSLITSGTGSPDGASGGPNGVSVDNLLVGISESGDDAFFTTLDRLVGWDTDDVYDIYDARVGEVFPGPPVRPVGCDPGSDGCKGAGAGQVGTSPGTAGGSGSNAVATPRGVLRLEALTRAQRVALAYGVTVRMGFVVNRPGTLTVRGDAKIAKRTRRVLSARRTVSKGQRVAIPLKLSRPARLQLARTGKLRLRITSRFSNVRGALTTTVGLERRATATTTHRGR